MSCDLNDIESSSVDPVLAVKSRSVPRVDNRRVLNRVFWVLHLGLPCADLPDHYCPHTTC